MDQPLKCHIGTVNKYISDFKPLAISKAVHFCRYEACCCRVQIQDHALLLLLLEKPVADLETWSERTFHSIWKHFRPIEVAITPMCCLAKGASYRDLTNFNYIKILVFADHFDVRVALR